jgi:uncharacterized membrane protein YdjX (TVP38/TMEM64 family)
MKDSLKKWLLIGFLAAFIVAAVILQRIGVINLDPIFTYIKDSGPFGWFLFVALLVAWMIAGLLGSVLAVAAGYLFGPALGLILSLISAYLAATISFFLSRYLLHDHFHKKFSHMKFLQWTRLESQEKLKALMLSMRIIHFVPFSITNYLFGLTKIKFSSYFWITFFAIIPETFAYVFLGHSLTDLLSIKFWIILAAIVITIIALYKLRHRIFFRKSGEVDIELEKTEIKINPEHRERKD